MKSFKSRLVLSVTLLTAAVSAFVAVWAYQTASDALAGDMDRLLRDRAYALSKSVTPMNLRLQPWMESLLETDKLGLLVQVLDAEGKVVSRSANLIADMPFSAAARAAAETNLTGFTESIPGIDGEIRLATVPVTNFRNGENQILAYTQAALPESARGKRLRGLAWGLAGAGLAAVVAAWLVSRILARTWLRSVDAAVDSARRIGAGETLRERLFVPKDEDEVARLAGAFNELLDRLESAHANQQRFLADASHELRTPLTVLRGEIEVALRRERPAEEYREVLESSREEIERLARLTENLLSLARSDAGEAVAAPEPVDLAEVCRKVVDSLANRATSKRIGLSVEETGPVIVSGDSLALERIVLNLVENAIRYSPAGETVTLRTQTTDKEAVLTVSDTGPGIAPEHLPHLFERFYRVDKARAREHGGAGLGLAIVEALVHAHGGRVSVASEVGQGTVFTLSLPLAAAS
jgi:two-component system OmpR family sensor kinase